jgi:GH15 family glucan-1,4-alpha-glucosidase
VDASLLWLATPFGLVRDEEPVFRRTLECIEERLVSDGGLLRYPEDTFYGGGAWILVTAWLAWHHARNGRPERASAYLAWIERQRCGDGGLPEQVSVSATDPWFERYWTERWGASARPLLWSHAMTILAHG